MKKLTLTNGSIVGIANNGVIKVWPPKSRIMYDDVTDVWYGLMGTVRPIVVRDVETLHELTDDNTSNH